MSQNSPKREARRNAARRNAAANEIAEAVSAGVAPNPESVRAWRLASMRLYAAQKRLRPRECGAPLGEGLETMYSYTPRRQGFSFGLFNRDAGRGPESGTSSTQTERNDQT